MSNFNIRIVGTANVQQAKAEFAKLQASAAALNAEMSKMVISSDSLNPKGYKDMTRALAVASDTYRAAAASSGQFTTSQLKVKSATEEYTKALERQKLSFRDIAKNSKLARAAYREQLALQNMVVRNAGTDKSGRQLLDVTVPNEVHKSLNTLGNQIGWIREQTRSASTQMINWGKNTQWAGRQLMVGFTLPVAAFGAAAGVLAYKMENQITRIQKVYNTTASQNAKTAKQQIALETELGQVRTDALNTAAFAAKTYGVSMNDTLDVQAELAATGKKGGALQKATAEVLRLSTLGEVDYATSLKSAIALQSVFKMSTEDLTKSIDFMNSVENATSLQTKDFAEAIPIASAPIKQMGGDVKTLGILLTAMRERGISATQGANAIKASMQRLFRPSAQIATEFERITGASILDIRDTNKGNLINMLKEIYNVTKDLSRVEQTQVFAGLFGSYQVTRMSALINGMGDLENGVGQVSAAYKIAGQDSSKWAQTAQYEINQVKESLSGKFKRSLETLKVTIAQMGAPFLEVATIAINSLNKIGKGFNALPSWIKKFGAVGLAVLAVAGPLLMLTGLAANFAGNFLKMIVSLTGGLTTFKLVNKESVAASLASRLAERGYVSQAEAVRMLIAQLSVLHEAQAIANRDAYMAAAATQGAAMGISPRYAAGSQISRSGPAGPTSPTWMSPKFAGVTSEIETSTEKTAKNVKGAAVSGGLFAAAMAASLISSNKTVDEIAQMTMLMAGFGPLLSPAARFLTQWGTIGVAGVRKWGVAFKTNVVTSMEQARVQSRLLSMDMATSRTAAGKAPYGAMTTALSRSRVAATGVAVAMRGAALSALEFIGPAGVVIGGIFLLSKVYNWLRKSRQEQEQIEKSAKMWADHLGYAYKTSAKIANNVSKVSTPLETQAQNLEKSAPALVKRLSDLAPTERENAMIDEAIKILQHGGTVDNVRQAIKEMYWLQTHSTTKAADMTNKFMGQINWKKWESVMALQVSQLGKNVNRQISTSGWDQGAWQSYARGAAQRFWDTYGPADRENRRKFLDMNLEMMAKQWDSVYAAEKKKTGTLFANLGISSMQSFRDAVTKGKNMDLGGLKEMFPSANDKDIALFLNILHTIGSDIDNVVSSESTLSKQFAAQVGLSSDVVANISTMADLSLAVSKDIGAIDLSKFDTWKQAMKSMERLGIWDKLNFVERAMLQMNYEIIQASHHAKDFDNNLDGVDQKARRIAENLKLVKGLDLQSTMKDAMSGIQENIGDSITSNFEDQMNAAADSLDKSQQAREDAQQARQEAQTRKFEREWNKRKRTVSSAYDQRIKAIHNESDAEKKADDIRQRLFEAQMARLDRLAEAENRNIDFNVALNQGNLDEAAKIRNDMESSYQDFMMGKSGDKESRKSEHRQAKLDKRASKLEHQRDRAMKALDRAEEHERRQLEKTQKLRSDALKDELDEEKKTAQAIWENRKEMLDKTVSELKNSTARSSSELSRWLKELGAKNSDFKNGLEKSFGTSNNRIKQMLIANMKDSRRQIMNSIQWEAMGKSIANKMIRGAFGVSPERFKKWIATGNPKFLEARPDKKPSTAITSATTKNEGQLGTFYHKGGVAGVDRGSRVGHSGGMSRSEVPATLLRGEGVVNNDGMKNLGAGGLKDLNSGKPVGGAGMGMVGLMGAIMARAVTSTLSQGIMVGASKAIKQKGSFHAGRPGKYSGLSLDAAQLHNAQTIANTGRNMGMSRRDIEIGIMTAITESMLKNIHSGDRDSLGLFQQRPSQGWGSPTQVTNPEYAARKFFESLRNVSNRGDISPWMAAQAVQRSAFSDGSNYHRYWDEAKAIFGSMGRASGLSGGSGGWHLPIAGKRVGNTHAPNAGSDIRVPVGTPVHAVYDGSVMRSTDIRGKNPYDNDGYASYGKYIMMRHALDSGPAYSLYAHLSKRGVGVGSKVRGGKVIGLSGSTGNSSGPHLHFEIGKGLTPNTGAYPGSFLAARGLPALEHGAMTLSDGIAMLHRGETVATKPLTSDIIEGGRRFAEGAGNEYNFDMHFYDVDNKEEVARYVFSEFERKTNRLPKSKKTGGS